MEQEAEEVKCLSNIAVGALTAKVVTQVVCRLKKARVVHQDRRNNKPHCSLTPILRCNEISDNFKFAFAVFWGLLSLQRSVKISEESQRHDLVWKYTVFHFCVRKV